QPTGTLTSFSGIALADATTTTISSDNNSACENAQVTFTATVTTTGGSTPTGTVEFFDGTVLIGTGSLDAIGIATFSTTSLSPGTHTIKATYNGDANNDVSNSTDLTQDIFASPAVTADDKQVCFGNNSIALT